MRVCLPFPEATFVISRTIQCNNPVAMGRPKIVKKKSPAKTETTSSEDEAQGNGRRCCDDWFGLRVTLTLHYLTKAPLQHQCHFNLEQPSDQPLFLQHRTVVATHLKLPQITVQKSQRFLLIQRKFNRGKVQDNVDCIEFSPD